MYFYFVSFEMIILFINYKETDNSKVSTAKIGGIRNCADIFQKIFRTAILEVLGFNLEKKNGNITFSGFFGDNLDEKIPHFFALN